MKIPPIDLILQFVGLLCEIYGVIAMAWTYLRAKSVWGLLSVLASALLGGNRAATKADLESLAKRTPAKTIVLSLHGLAWICLGFVLQTVALVLSSWK